MSRDIYNWLLGSFSVESVSGNEVRFPCPYCEHPNFYFNMSKKVGFCHRASCHHKPTLEDLIDIVGYSPETAGYIPELDNRVNRKALPKKVSLPPYIVPIRDRKDSWAIEALCMRGVDYKKIVRYNIHSSKSKIVVPVYHEGELVQYVCRFIDRSKPPEEGFQVDGRRYDYFPGVPITNYLFNWEFHNKTARITLVENTFNAIWLENLGVVTNFGSHLSDQQVELIKKSAVKQVLFLWDEGTNCSRAIRKLRTIGVKANYFPLKMQPDDHIYNWLETTIYECHREIYNDTYSPLISEIAIDNYLSLNNRNVKYINGPNDRHKNPSK